SIEQAAQAKPQQPTELGSMETFRESVQAPSAPSAPAAAVGVSPHKVSPPRVMARTGAGPAYLQLMDERMQPVTRIDLNKEVTRVGRDPEGEVIIDATAAVVSRRHAEVRKEGDKFKITDLKSFNGTLDNRHRIAESVPLCDGDQIQLGVGGPILRIVDPANPAPPHRAIQPGAPSPSQQLIPAAFDQIAAMARGATMIATGTGSMP